MRAYYNEFDPFAAAWLRELMADGLIPKGDVDERSIADVQPRDLTGYTQCHFFAGIGGWSHALRLAGWPDTRPVWTGSCPCQPFSVAGKGAGASDPRHLWPEFHRLIAECQPPVVFGEQVASKAGRDWLSGVRADLEGLGYGVGAADLCAASVGAPHIRQRLWWAGERVEQSAGDGWQQRGAESGGRSPVGGRGVGGLAFSEGQQHDRSGDTGRGRGEPANGGGAGGLADDDDTGLEGHAGHGDNGHEPGWLDADSAGPVAAHGHTFWASAVWHPCRDEKFRRIPVEPALFPLADGLPGRVGLLRGAGNAIVPQVAAAFVRAYMEATPPPAAPGHQEGEKDVR